MNKQLLPIAAFAVFGGVILLASSLASTDSTKFNVTQATLTDIELTNDADAYGGKSLVFADTTDPDPDPDPDPDGYPPATYNQIDSPEIPSQTTSLASVPADPADSPNNKVVVVTCAATGNCAAKVSAAISSNSERPLKVQVKSSENNTVFWSSGVRLGPDISVEGVNQPTIVRAVGNFKLFYVGGSKNTSVRNFDINLRLCQPKTVGGDTSIFDSLAGAKIENLHISNIKGFNGTYIYDSSIMNTRHKPKSAGDCDFIRSNIDADGVYIHNVAWSYTRRFVHLRKGEWKNLKMYDNDVRHMNRGFFDLHPDAAVDDLVIQNNNFSIITAGHKNYRTGDTRIIDLAGKARAGVAGSQNVKIIGNTLNSPGYQTPAFYHFSSNSVVEPTTVAPLGGELIYASSLNGFEITGNTLADSIKDGIRLTSGVSNGSLSNNSFADITGQDINNDGTNVTIN